MALNSHFKWHLWYLQAPVLLMEGYSPAEHSNVWATLDLLLVIQASSESKQTSGEVLQDVSPAWQLSPITNLMNHWPHLSKKESIWAPTVYQTLMQARNPALVTTEVIPALSPPPGICPLSRPFPSGLLLPTGNSQRIIFDDKVKERWNWKRTWRSSYHHLTLQIERQAQRQRWIIQGNTGKETRTRTSFLTPGLFHPACCCCYNSSGPRRANQD